MIRALPLAALLLLPACVAEDVSTIQMDPRPAPQSAAEVAFVTQLFNDIQPTSIAEGREYCGLLGLDAGGALVATEPRRGRASSCLPPDPRNVDFIVLASYHTHGAYNPEYLTELPSFEDMATDIEDNTDGYVATPGGRLWYVNARAQVAQQLCGRACLVSDVGYVPDPNFPVRTTYTLNDLRAF